MGKYIIGIDQSTQGTKVILFDEKGGILLRLDRAHRQIIDERGWVEHDPEEIYGNLIALVRELLEKSGIDRADVAAVGISNQRETALAWSRATGRPVYNAVVWQCARGAAICRRLEQAHPDLAETVRVRTGLRHSPYFSAPKLAWILENVPGVREAALLGEICCGTMDSFLVFRLTHGGSFLTDYSNASRTELFNIMDLCWDRELCGLFGIPEICLPGLMDSDGCFGETDFEGLLPRPVPIHGVMGDSHAALFGQGCLERGQMKATYGTGSSIMMNIGERPVLSEKGIVTSLAWKARGRVQYVLEGNINYTGAVISWLKNDVGLLQSAGECEAMALAANPEDHTCLIPAFSGLGAPYWRSDVQAAFVGMSRTTGRNELVRAGVDCIAHQITDIVELMRQEADIPEVELRADGGPTRNGYLMQLQADLIRGTVRVPEAEELSCIGAAWAAGLGIGLYDDRVFTSLPCRVRTPAMPEEKRATMRSDWQRAVAAVLGK